MIMTVAKLLNSTVKNQVYLEGLKASQASQFTAFLKRIDLDLRERLTAEDLTDFSRSRLEKLLKSIEKTINGIFDEYYEDLAGHLVDIGQYEAEFEIDNLVNSIASELFEPVIPSPEQVRSAVFNNPLSVRGADGGKLLESFIKGWMSSDVKMLTGQIRQGFFEGQTNFEILRNIRGTKAKNYSDGALAVVDRHAKTIVRTAVQHTASTARMQTWIKNGIKQYTWLSTLDGRTSTICRSLDQEIYDIGKGPVPPIHLNCRSTTMAKLPSKYDYLDKGATRASKEGPVDAKLGYYEWLKRQDGDFQDEVLGPARGKLFRDGGLSVERFKQLQLDKNFKSLTLDEMRRKEKAAFERLNTLEIVTEESAKDYVVSNGRKYGGEFAYAGNPETGDFLFKKRGEDSSVNFTSREQAKLRRDTVLYHNHPSGLSLSSADLEFTAATKIKEIVAFGTHNDGEYRASTNMGRLELRSLYNRTDEFVRDRMWPLIRNRSISSSDANNTHAHIVNTLLNKSGAINYKAVKIGDNMREPLERLNPLIGDWIDEYNLS